MVNISLSTGKYFILIYLIIFLKQLFLFICITIIILEQCLVMVSNIITIFEKKSQLKSFNLLKL